MIANRARRTGRPPQFKLRHMIIHCEIESACTVKYIDLLVLYWLDRVAPAI